MNRQILNRQMFAGGGAAFPDLSGDGKVTQKDILMGRGVVPMAGGGNVQYYQDAGVVGPYDEDGTGAGGDDAGLSIVNNLLGNILQDMGTERGLEHIRNLSYGTIENLIGAATSIGGLAAGETMAVQLSNVYGVGDRETSDAFQEITRQFVNKREGSQSTFESDGERYSEGFSAEERALGREISKEERALGRDSGSSMPFITGSGFERKSNIPQSVLDRMADDMRRSEIPGLERIPQSVLDRMADDMKPPQRLLDSIEKGMAIPKGMAYGGMVDPRMRPPVGMAEGGMMVDEGIGALMAQEGPPPMGQGMDGPEVAMEQTLGAAAEGIGALDASQDYEQAINSVRGDQLPMEARYEELASFVGPNDAAQTPESVLALVQPVFQMAEVDQGIGSIAPDAMGGEAPMTPEMAGGIMSNVPEAPPMDAGPPLPFNQGGAARDINNPVQYYAEGGAVLNFEHGGATHAYDDLEEEVNKGLALYQKFGAGSEEDRAKALERQKQSARSGMYFDIAEAALRFAGTPVGPGESIASVAAKSATESKLFPKISARAGTITELEQKQAAEKRSLNLAALTAGETRLAAKKVAEESANAFDRKVAATIAAEERAEGRLMSKEDRDLMRQIMKESRDQGYEISKEERLEKFEIRKEEREINTLIDKEARALKITINAEDRKRITTIKSEQRAVERAIAAEERLLGTTISSEKRAEIRENTIFERNLAETIKREERARKETIGTEERALFRKLAEEERDQGFEISAEQRAVIIEKNREERAIEIEINRELRGTNRTIDTEEREFLRVLKKEERNLKTKLSEEGRANLRADFVFDRSLEAKIKEEERREEYTMSGEERAVFIAIEKEKRNNIRNDVEFQRNLTAQIDAEERAESRVFSSEERAEFRRMAEEQRAVQITIGAEERAAITDQIKFDRDLEAAILTEQRAFGRVLSKEQRANVRKDFEFDRDFNAKILVEERDLGRKLNQEERDLKRVIAEEERKLQRAITDDEREKLIKIEEEKRGLLNKPFGSGFQAGAQAFLSDPINLRIYKNGTASPEKIQEINELLTKITSPSTVMVNGVNTPVPGRKLSPEWEAAIKQRQKDGKLTPEYNFAKSKEEIQDDLYRFVAKGSDGEYLSRPDYSRFGKEAQNIITGIDLTSATGVASSANRFFGYLGGQLSEFFGDDTLNRADRTTQLASNQLSLLANDAMDVARAGKTGRIFALDIKNLDNEVKKMRPGGGKTDPSLRAALVSIRDTFGGTYMSSILPILSNPEYYTADQVTKARTSKLQIEGLLHEFTAAIAVFDRFKRPVVSSSEQNNNGLNPVSILPRAGD